MRIVACSDAHFDFVTAGVPRFGDVSAAMWKVLTAAKGTDLFAFLGDAYDPDAGSCVHRCAAELVRCAEWLTEHLSVPSIWLAGNHDVIEDGSGETVLEVLKQVTGMQLVRDRPSYERAYARPFHGGEEYDVLSLPFTALSAAYDPAAFVASCKKDWSNGGLSEAKKLLVLSHLSVEGIQPGEETKEMPRGRSVAFPSREVAALAARYEHAVVLQGHYHRGQVHRLPGGLEMHVVGSLERLTFSEEKNSPGWLEVDL